MKNEFKIEKICFDSCLSHAFHFSPKNSQCWNKLDLDISFCPHYNKLLKFSYSKSYTKETLNIIPTFNHDQNPCLPAFYLQREKVILIINNNEDNFVINLKKYEEDHANKANEYSMKKTELFLPRPNRKHRYCALCRKEYDDYKNHLSTREHQEKFAHHKYVLKIEKLTQEFSTIQEDFRGNSSQQSDYLTSISKCQTQSTLQLKQQIKEQKKARGRPRKTEEEKQQKKDLDYIKKKISRTRNKQQNQSPVFQQKIIPSQIFLIKKNMCTTQEEQVKSILPIIKDSMDLLVQDF